MRKRAAGSPPFAASNSVHAASAWYAHKPRRQTAGWPSLLLLHPQLPMIQAAGYSARPSSGQLVLLRASEGLPDLSNNADVVKSFLSAPIRSLRRVVFVVLFPPLCINDHGSFVIFRSASVRPRHLFDQNFDHNYFCKLPLQGAGCPIMCTALYFTPCPVPSCPGVRRFRT
jgi:hypothetical protein